MFSISRDSVSALSLARGVGMFGIALGAAQLLRTSKLSRATGLQNRAPLIKACGWRQLATGIGLLATRNPSPWLWARVAGDALDLVALGTGPRRSRRLNTTGVAAAVIAGVTALELYSASRMRREAGKRNARRYDYSDRSGLPRRPEEMRGAVRPDFTPSRAADTPGAAAAAVAP